MLTIYPDADSFWELDTISKKPFSCIGPTGITVHYTADDDIERVKRSMKESVIGYHFLISKDGKIHQTSRIDKTVDQAGRAIWQRKSPNRTHIAISLVSWGRLNEEKNSWTGKHVSDAVFRFGYWWDSASKEQEESIVKLCKYIRDNVRIPFDSIAGHDEICIPKGRKIDPGHVMSFDIEALRRKIWP